MDKITLNAQERNVLGKKVKRLRKDGFIPGHVFGKNTETEHVLVSFKDFNPVFHLAGETGLISLKIGEEKIRPVLVRNIQYDPRTDAMVHIDFYQVDLKVKVKVPVPIVLVGEEPESVKMGENVVLQNLSEVEVEALPADLVENIEVNIEVLKNVEDAVTVSQLNYDREKLTVLAEGEEVVVKLAPAVTEEMKALLEEQEAEAEAAQAEAVAEEGGEVAEESAEGEAGETAEGGSADGEDLGDKEEPKQEKAEDQPTE